MLYDLTDQLAQLGAMRDELQAEIDAATDQHAAISRAIAALEGTADVPQGWLPVTAERGDINSEFAIVDAAPIVHDLDVAIAEARAGLLVAKPSSSAARAIKPRKGAIDMQVVADWIAQAKASGTYSLKALAVAFDRPESAVKNWPKACRDRGLLVDPLADPVAPTVAREVSTPAPMRIRALGPLPTSFTPDDAAGLLEAM